MRSDRIVKGSMGSGLTPPDHPSQKYEVETDLRRKKENRGAMNLDYALTDKFVSVATKKEIKQLLAEWEDGKLPIHDERVQEWIAECESHFGENKAELYVRSYYPEYRKEKKK